MVDVRRCGAVKVHGSKGSAVARVRLPLCRAAVFTASHRGGGRSSKDLRSVVDVETQTLEVADTSSLVDADVASLRAASSDVGGLQGPSWGGHA